VPSACSGTTPIARFLNDDLAVQRRPPGGGDGLVLGQGDPGIVVDGRFARHAPRRLPCGFSHAGLGLAAGRRRVYRTCERLAACGGRGSAIGVLALKHFRAKWIPVRVEKMRPEKRSPACRAPGVLVGGRLDRFRSPRPAIWRSAADRTVAGGAGLPGQATLGLGHEPDRAGSRRRPTCRSAAPGRPGARPRQAVALAVRDPARPAKDAFAERITALADSQANPAKANAALRKLTRPPVAVAVISRFIPGEIPEWEQRQSASAVCQQMLLAAAALGWGANWITDWYAYDPRAQDILGLSDGRAGGRLPLSGHLDRGSAGARAARRGGDHHRVVRRLSLFVGRPVALRHRCGAFMKAGHARNDH
jgi:nitroreductase